MMKTIAIHRRPFLMPSPMGRAHPSVDRLEYLSMVVRRYNVIIERMEDGLTFSINKLAKDTCGDSQEIVPSLDLLDVW